MREKRYFHIDYVVILFDKFKIIIQNRRMKKKTQVVSLLDQLRSQDPKKRFSSVQSIKQIASAIGPARARTQFIQYLAEFIDDQQYIVLELMSQLRDFGALLGGQQHQKTLLPLLIGFCKTDQKKEAEKATQIMEQILTRNREVIVDVVKKLFKTQMNTSKQAAIKLVSSLIYLVPQSESQLMQIYSGMIFSEIPAYKIIGAKYLSKLLESAKNKEQIGKMIEVIYSDNDDLPKIFALEALANYYSVNSNLSISKFKGLLVLNNWRINIKICEAIPSAFKVFSKAHFKSTFQASLLKFLSSSEPQLRCKSCIVLQNLAAIMSQDDVKKILIPAIKKLTTDPVDYVKVQMSEHIVGLAEVCSPAVINDEILPIIITFIKSNELAVGIVKNLQAMTKRFSSTIIEEKILTPLVTQFSTDNWRIKCQLVQLFGSVINSSLFLNDKMTTMLVSLVSDRISAVRQKATQLIINIICQQSPQWCDNMLIPKLAHLRQSSNYTERQIILQIIQKTCDKVSQKTLCDNYRQTVLASLTDKISNVRARALRAVKTSRKLNDKIFDKYIEKMKNDTDGQVRQLAIAMAKG